METLSNLLVIVSNLFIIAVMVTYFRQVKNAESTPNPSTWLIWFLVGLLNTSSYMTLMKDDPFKGIVSITVILGIGTIFIYTTVKHKFSKIGWTEWATFVLTAAIVFYWLSSGNAKIANILTQTLMVYSFWPTIWGLITGKGKEKWLPWALALTAYALAITAIAIDFDGNWAKLVYPIANGIVGNGSVLITIIVISKTADST